MGLISRSSEDCTFCTIDLDDVFTDGMMKVRMFPGDVNFSRRNFLQSNFRGGRNIETELVDKNFVWSLTHLPRPIQKPRMGFLAEISRRESICTHQTRAQRMVPARNRAMTPRTLTRGTTLGYASKDQYNGSYIPTLYSIRQRKGQQPGRHAVDGDGTEETIASARKERGGRTRKSERNRE